LIIILDFSETGARLKIEPKANKYKFKWVKEDYVTLQTRKANRSKFPDWLFPVFIF